MTYYNSFFQVPSGLYFTPTLGGAVAPFPAFSPYTALFPDEMAASNNTACISLALQMGCQFTPVWCDILAFTNSTPMSKYQGCLKCHLLSIIHVKYCPNMSITQTLCAMTMSRRHYISRNSIIVHCNALATWQQSHFLDRLYVYISVNYPVLAGKIP